MFAYCLIICRCRGQTGILISSRCLWCDGDPLPSNTNCTEHTHTHHHLLLSSSPPSYSHAWSTSCCALQTSVPDSAVSLVSSLHRLLFLLLLLLLDRCSSVHGVAAAPHLCPCFCHRENRGCGSCWVLCLVWSGGPLCEEEEEEEDSAQVQALDSRTRPTGSLLAVEGCTARVEEARASSLYDSLSPPPPLPCRRALPQGRARGYVCGLLLRHLLPLGLESECVTAAPL